MVTFGRVNKQYKVDKIFRLTTKNEMAQEMVHLVFQWVQANGGAQWDDQKVMNF